MSNEKQQLVYVLDNNGIKAIHFDIDALCDQLKTEYDSIHDEDALELKFEVTAKFMTEAEIDNLPEFDGF